MQTGDIGPDWQNNTNNEDRRKLLNEHEFLAIVKTMKRFQSY